ncbi:protein of unknown function [Bartonella clarridgeiae 73]|uniref:Uncharacterized protein n=1 Tax=Bartonella clarridgeiae (strain CCUG 45776 / CIP 104772 / 73) TaxID=696125 RepID=E6YI39_BARC7|nr:protein of unknown function [Bartonella clarridgeiae 73]
MMYMHKLMQDKKVSVTCNADE